jgi:hypothetical protein
MLKKLLFCFLICQQASLSAQSYKTFNWKDAGFKGVKPVYNQTVNIMNTGGNNTNSASNNAALIAAIAALNNKGGVIYFPKGVYSFTGSISINRDSITFKGAGYDSTQLRFNFGGVLNNCINIWGSQVNTDTTSFSSPGIRDSSSVNVLNAGAFSAGQWVYLQTSDNAYMNDSWAYGSLGQVMQIKTISGNKITFYSPFRFYYTLALQPKIKKINPRKVIGFECMKLQRLDATTNQTSIFSYDKAVQCWIHGIESDSSNFSHIEFNRSSNIDVTNSWFHHAFDYGSGGGGKGYGLVLQFSSNEIKVENNIFQNLRHSVLFQAGSNGNVIGYNYSFNPFWNQFPFPSNSAGDLVLHGNYPFANLFEGNINQNTVIDNSHKNNGPHNTFFRNRSELYGIVMNNSPATDTVQFIGNEVTSTTNGQYLLYGNGHYEFGNMIQGTLTPPGTSGLAAKSLYYTDPQKPICFNPGNNNWPVIGMPNGYNTGSNSAKDRIMQGVMAACVCTPSFTTGEDKITTQNKYTNIFPNPVAETLHIKSTEYITEISVYSMDGRLILNKTGRNIQSIEVASLKTGIYGLGLKHKKGIDTFKFIKE